MLRRQIEPPDAPRSASSVDALCVLGPRTSNVQHHLSTISLLLVWQCRLACKWPSRIFVWQFPVIVMPTRWSYLTWPTDWWQWRRKGVGCLRASLDEVENSRVSIWPDTRMVRILRKSFLCSNHTENTWPSYREKDIWLKIVTFRCKGASTLIKQRKKALVWQQSCP